MDHNCPAERGRSTEIKPLWEQLHNPWLLLSWEEARDPQVVSGLGKSSSRRFKCLALDLLTSFPLMYPRTLCYHPHSTQGETGAQRDSKHAQGPTTTKGWRTAGSKAKTLSSSIATDIAKWEGTKGHRLRAGPCQRPPMGDPNAIQRMESIRRVGGGEMWVVPTARLRLQACNHSISTHSQRARQASSACVHRGEIQVCLTTLSLGEFKLPGACFEHHMATPFVNFLINLHLMFLADIADSCLDTLFH